jgi:NAD+ kinase
LTGSPEVSSMIEEAPRILTERRAVGLVCRPGRAETDRLAQNVVDFLVGHDVDVKVNPGSCNVVSKGAKPTPIEDMDVDFVTVIGGDGSILHTVSKLRNKATPLFCINLGTVGFMTESDAANALNSLEKILAGKCIIERCVNLSSGIGDRSFEDALNEVYVASRVHGRLLAFNIYLDGTKISFGRADGVMVATPSGSTAYGLSAPGIAVIAGQTRWDVQPSEKVWVKKAKGVTRFIRLYDNYYDRLRTRLVPSSV